MKFVISRMRHKLSNTYTHTVVCDAEIEKPSMDMERESPSAVQCSRRQWKPIFFSLQKDTLKMDAVIVTRRLLPSGSRDDIRRLSLADNCEKSPHHFYNSFCFSVSEKEIKQWHKGFLKDCPNGLLTEQGFIKIYTQFFPNGDPTKFASLVFRVFDENQVSPSFLGALQGQDCIWFIPNWWKD